MEMEHIEKQIRDIVVEQLGVEPDKVQMSSSFTKDLGADSLDIVELIMKMEEAFEIQIPDKDAQGMETIQDVINYLKEKNKIN